MPSLDQQGRGRARLGILVPASNRNLEPDFQLMAPAGVSVHAMRLGGYDLDAVPDATQMRKYADGSLSAPLAMLNAARVDVIAYGCTSATLANGPQFDHELANRIESTTGTAAVTAAGALIEALGILGITKIAFTSPYVESLHIDAMAFLKNCGMKVVHHAYPDAKLDSYEQGDMTPDAVYALGLRADHPNADALVMSCTEMRSVEALGALEAKLGKPVVTSNQAMMCTSLMRVGIDPLEASPDCSLFAAASAQARDSSLAI